MRAAVSIVALASACAARHAPAPCLSGEARGASGWSAAEELFRSDPAWLGGDAAYSADLGNGRVLWLFGDSFAARAGSRGRAGAAMPRNTIAIQHGYDPARASIDFHARRDASGAPASWFAEPSSDRWYWPGPATKVGSSLVVFLWRVRASSDALGFSNDAPFVARVSNPDDAPEAWTMTVDALPTNPWGVFLGTGAAIVEGDHLYVLSSVEPGNHDMYLARWSKDDVARGTFADPEWRTDEGGGFTRQSALRGAPLRVFDGGHTELSVHFDPRARVFVEVQSRGFPKAEVIMRTAPALTGPWSTPRVVYRPPEDVCPSVLVYAAKAHPELASPSLGGAVAITYATNSLDLGALVRDTSLYFPRFVRLDVEAGAARP